MPCLPVHLIRLFGSRDSETVTTLYAIGGHVGIIPEQVSFDEGKTSQSKVKLQIIQPSSVHRENLCKCLLCSTW